MTTAAVRLIEQSVAGRARPVTQRKDEFASSSRKICKTLVDTG